MCVWYIRHVCILIVVCVVCVYCVWGMCDMHVVVYVVLGEGYVCGGHVCGVYKGMWVGVWCSCVWWMCVCTAWHVYGVHVCGVVCVCVWCLCVVFCVAVCMCGIRVCMCGIRVCVCVVSVYVGCRVVCVCIPFIWYACVCVVLVCGVYGMCCGMYVWHSCVCSGVYVGCGGVCVCGLYAVCRGGGGALISSGSCSPRLTAQPCWEKNPLTRLFVVSLLSRLDLFF